MDDEEVLEDSQTCSLYSLESDITSNMDEQEDNSETLNQVLINGNEDDLIWELLITAIDQNNEGFLNLQWKDLKHR